MILIFVKGNFLPLEMSAKLRMIEFSYFYNNLYFNFSESE